MANKIQLRRDSASNWTNTNPVLSQGEPGYDLTNNKIKVGDGTSNWVQLGYLTDAAGSNYSDGDVANYLTTNGYATETFVTNAVGAINIPTTLTNLGITDGTSGQVLTTDGAGAFTFATVSGGGADLGNLTIVDKTISSITGDIVISPALSASPAVGFFTFASDGDLSIPGAINYPNYAKQISAGNTNCPANADTVVYTSTSQWQHTIKILFKVEGTETTGWDTQSCEMMVAKSFRNDLVVGSVYGLVYTSTNPLASFTTRWNASTSRVEILCRPTSITNNVSVRSFVTEITTSD